MEEGGRGLRAAPDLTLLFTTLAEGVWFEGIQKADEAKCRSKITRVLIQEIEVSCS